MASNVTWQEHNWTRLGAEPPPQGVNVVEEYVGAAACASGVQADFAPLSEQKQVHEEQQVHDPQTVNVSTKKRSVANGQGGPGLIHK